MQFQQGAGVGKENYNGCKLFSSVEGNADDQCASAIDAKSSYAHHKPIKARADNENGEAYIKPNEPVHAFAPRLRRCTSNAGR